MTNVEMLQMIETLMKEGAPILPDKQSLQELSNASDIMIRQKEINRELSLIVYKMRQRASMGYFDSGDYLPIKYEENIENLKEAGYVLIPSEDTCLSKYYKISWDARVVDEGSVQSDNESVEVSASAEGGIAGGNLGS
jgi:hypothetical protein